MSDQAATVEVKSLRIPGSLKSLLEGLIFASDEPLTVKEIKAIYEQTPGEGERHIEEAEVQRIVAELNEEYKRDGKPYRILAVAGGFQFATLREYGEWIGRLYREQARRKLSQSSLETLAIVAYKQPISKPEIESIRGVNCDYVLKTLLEKELVTITGRAETVGRPLLYGTTREFLRHFGLNDVTDLPRPREIEEILGESQFETERRMLEAQMGGEQMKKEEEDFKSRLPHIPKKKPEMDETVQILPKRKSRQIAVRPKEESPASEASPGAVPEEPVVSENRMVETTEKEITAAQGDELAVEEKPLEIRESVEPAEASLTRAEQPGDYPISSVANEPQSTDVTDALASNSLPQSAPQSHEPELTQPHKTRWIAWKEKIQSFIKKLFV